MSPIIILFESADSVKVDYLLQLLFCLFREGSCEFSNAIRLPYISEEILADTKSVPYTYVLTARSDYRVYACPIYLRFT